MKKLTLILMIVLISSCIQNLSIHEVGRKPTNKEAISFVKKHIEKHIKKGSVVDMRAKNLKVKEPIYTTIMVGKYFPYPQKGWAICYQFEAELYNSYLGIKAYSIGVQNGRLKEQGDSQIGWRYCGRAKWIK